MKTCTKCKGTFPFSEFRKQNSTKDGLKYYCKRCDDKIAKKYYERNKNKIVSNVKQWQKDNPSKVREYKKSYYGKNKLHDDKHKQKIYSDRYTSDRLNDHQ